MYVPCDSPQLPNRAVIDFIPSDLALWKTLSSCKAVELDLIYGIFLLYSAGLTQFFHISTFGFNTRDNYGRSPPLFWMDVDVLRGAKLLLPESLSLPPPAISQQP